MDALDGKVAVITGGASGIGFAMARRFAQAGMGLVLGDIEPDALGAAADRLRADGADVATMVCDVSERAQVEGLRDVALSTFGGVHVVCNNAGVGAGGMLETLSDHDWEWVLGVNLYGVIYGVQTFLPLLREQDEGHIVNTASIAGLIAPPIMGPYNVAKYGVVALSETLFAELGMSGSNVGCSVLCPIWVRTRIHESARNRPDRLQAASDAAPTMIDTAAMLSAVIEAGMPPEQVADAVHDAVRSKKFYILTHDESFDMVRARMTAILEGGDPPVLFPQ